jgi:hypothetical protein
MENDPVPRGGLTLASPGSIIRRVALRAHLISSPSHRFSFFLPIPRAATPATQTRSLPRQTTSPPPTPIQAFSLTNLAVKRLQSSHRVRKPYLLAGRRRQRTSVASRASPSPRPPSYTGTAGTPLAGAVRLRARPGGASRSCFFLR